MKLCKYRFLKIYILTKHFFTNKKYFFYRHCLVVGVLLSLYDNQIRNGNGFFSLFNNWTDIILVPLSCFLIGLFFNAITYVCADAFCKDKTLS